ncbi:hypothetical protein [Candidiatus Paracoxiella cheracis]|uniref:hypothetical protein n=1 Tax=Candidiatus Paracoxiella cheracis TaxID=3405120 RepID=UPI003BF553F7
MIIVLTGKGFYLSKVQHMERADIKEEGVHLRRAKGSKDEVTLWTSRLEKVIRAAKRYHKDVISSYLIHDKDGLPIQEEAFTSAWQRLMKRALKHGLKERFTFHDIKAKGVSDHEKKHSGHHSDRMKRVYDRKVEHIESTR